MAAVAASRPAGTSSSSISSTSKAASSTGKDLWSQLIAERASSASASPPREASLVFLGPHSGGKSSLIQSFMFKDREEVPKPTTALDYRYTRTSVKDAMSDEKMLSHFWELGGGTTLQELMDVAVREDDDGVKDVLLVVVLDCGRVSALVDDAVMYINMARKRSEHVVQKMKAAGSHVGEHHSAPRSHPTPVHRPTVHPYAVRLCRSPDRSRPCRRSASERATPTCQPCTQRALRSRLPSSVRRSLPGRALFFPLPQRARAAHASPDADRCAQV